MDGGWMINHIKQHACYRAKVVGTWIFTRQFFNLFTCLQILIKCIETIDDRFLIEIQDTS